jgi:hypothetical protein
VEGLAGQIGTKATSDTQLARFPILGPGSFHLTAPALLEPARSAFDNRPVRQVFTVDPESVTRRS